MKVSDKQKENEVADKLGSYRKVSFFTNGIVYQPLIGSDIGDSIYTLLCLSRGIGREGQRVFMEFNEAVLYIDPELSVDDIQKKWDMLMKRVSP